MNILYKELPDIGISAFSLFLYENPQKPLDWARLVLSYNEKGRLNLEPAGQLVRTTQIIPEYLLSESQRHTLLLLPLYFKQEQIGFFITSAELNDSIIYENLRSEISNALFGAMLLKRVRENAEEVDRQKYILDTFMETIPDRIYFKDLDGRFVRYNNALSIRLGLHNLNDGIGKTDFDFFTEEEALKRHKDEQNIIKTGKPVIGLEENKTHPDGNQDWYITTKMPWRNEKGEIIGTFGISHDITELKLAQNSLEKAQRLESLGVLAGGIAHDFNNLLGGIFGYIELAKEQAKPDDGISDYLNKAMSAFIRAKALTNQLLIFAKGGAPVKKAVSLPDILDECIPLALSGSNVHCQKKLGNTLKNIYGDAGQLTQVFNNILLNSRQAMPAGGTIIISASNRVIGNNQIHTLTGGQYVQILIQDEGTGIPKNLLSRVFDPFFSTKQAGSGLGLATTYSIIKKHDGCITIDSQLEKGTTITMLLPVSNDKYELESDDGFPVFKRRAKILIMDDEQLILDIASAMLIKGGHEVVQAKDGEEAIQLYSEAFQSNHKIDLVFMDLTVPGGMGGEKAVQKLLEIDPAAKAIVSSGYSDNTVLVDPKQYGFMGMIVKPYRIKKLYQILHDVLDQA